MSNSDPTSPLPLIRAARRVKQSDLAAAIGVSAATLSRIENGSLDVSDQTLERIADALSCPVGVVGGGDFSVVARRGEIDIEAITST